VEGVSPLRFTSTNGVDVEARLISFGESFGPHERYTNETNEHVVDFWRLRPVRGPAHLASLSASYILGLGEYDVLPVGNVVLHPAEVTRLREWIESPFAASEELL
jgi:hypothetical protein